MADYEGKAWFEMDQTGISHNKIVENGTTCYMANIVEDDSGYATPFVAADNKAIIGIWASNQTLGNAVLTANGAVYSKFTLLNCYLTGIAVTDYKKPVWASGEDAGMNASAAADVSLTYTENAKLLGFVKRYSYALHADVFVDPKPFVRAEFGFSAKGYAAIDTGGAGSIFFTKTFSKDVIVRKLKAFINTAWAVTKGVDILVNTGTDVVTGKMEIRSTDAALSEKTQALTGDYLYVSAGTAIKLEYDASEGVAADAGDATFSIEYDEVPVCTEF